MDLQTSYKDIRLPKTVYENYIEDKLEQDLIIPDYYCSAQKIVHCETDAVVLSSSISNDKVMIEGQCVWKILYLSDEDAALHHITCERSFNESFTVDSAKGNLRYKIKTKNVLCKLHSPTRAECKATLCVAIKIDGTENKKILADTDDENVQLKREKSTYYELALRCEKEFKVIGELSLKLREKYDVYKSKADIIIRECKCYDDKAVVKGICRNRVILLSKSEHDAECIEIETPFAQMFEAETVQQGWLPCVHCRAIECDATVSEDGSDEVVTVTNSIVAAVDIYMPNEICIISDAYHLKNEISAKKETVEFYQDIQKMEISTQVSQKLHLNTKDMSVLYFDSCCEIEKIDVVDGVLIIDGRLLVDCLYTVNGDITYDTFAFPFQTTKPLMAEFESLKCEAEAMVKDLGFIILSDAEMEISCDCNLLLTVYSFERYEGITDIEAGKSKSEDTLLTPLVLYYGSKGEKLWDICKKYSVSVQSVVENNDVDGETLVNDQLVFITNR